MKKLIFLSTLFFVYSLCHAQTGNTYTPEEYEQLKKTGKLPAGNHTILLPSPVLQQSGTLNFKGDEPNYRGGGGSCGCYIEPDNTYTLSMSPNDDGSTNMIALPFTFCLYGDSYTHMYINNNGNISFGTPYSTFSATSFPTNQFVMVAPFWGDVDTRNGLGQVRHKITPTAAYINWVDVGYYNTHGDKRNTFQLIITDGNDPVIGVGNNVAFCYKDMQWTTGDASNGVNGFGGIAATVGSNRGNGVDFVQFGRFDQPGTAYDGPFGANDGVSWLDYKSFVFNTCVPGNNIAPIVSGLAVCDTIFTCVGQTVNYSFDFLSPENGQTTSITVNSGGMQGFTITNNTSGATANISFQIVASQANAGYNTLTFTATDNGTPPLATTVTLVIHIDTVPTPVITGPSEFCAGQSITLSVQGGNYSTYNWTPGNQNTSNITVNQPGTYTVTGTIGGCSQTSAPFLVTENPLPNPVILGASSLCGDAPNTTLTLNNSYVSYLWSNGSTDSSIVVSGGSYTVTVTDGNGCTNTSAQVTVSLSPEPVADFSFVPPGGTIFPGDTINFMDLSSVANPANIVSWTWNLGDGNNSALQNPAHIYAEPGEYTVCLIVETADGCNDTVCKTYLVLSREIIAPNVISPNGDGVNDYLIFKYLEYYPNSILKVYNRWGNLVYESDDYKNDWDGKNQYNGKILSDGTYYYVLTLKEGKTYKSALTIFGKN